MRMGGKGPTARGWEGDPIQAKYKRQNLKQWRQLNKQGGVHFNTSMQKRTGTSTYQGQTQGMRQRTNGCARQARKQYKMTDSMRNIICEAGDKKQWIQDGRAAPTLIKDERSEARARKKLRQRLLEALARANKMQGAG